MFSVNLKGQHLSIDAILCMLMIAAIASFPVQETKQGIGQEVLIFQQGNDLLRIWTSREQLSIEEMQKDTERMFSGRKIVLFFGNESKLINGVGEKSISSEIFYFNKRGDLLKLRIIVHY